MSALEAQQYSATPRLLNDGEHPVAGNIMNQSNFFIVQEQKTPQNRFIHSHSYEWSYVLSFPFFPCCCWSCAACQNAQRSGYCWTAVQATSDSCNPKRTDWKFSSSACQCLTLHFYCMCAVCFPPPAKSREYDGPKPICQGNISSQENLL